MPPVVVRKKPQTTSSVARPLEAADGAEGAGGDIDIHSPTTEVSRPITAAVQPRPPRQIRWGVIATVVAVGLLALGGGVALLGVLSRQARSAQSTVTPVPTATAPAPTSVIPTRLPPLPSATPDSPPAPTGAVDPTRPVDPTVEGAPAVPRLRVIVGSANVRSGPGIVFPIVTTLSAGTEVVPVAVVENNSGRWYVASLPAGGQGWISEQVVEAVNPALVDALPTAVIVPQLPPAPTATPRPTATPTPTLVPTLIVTLTPTPTLSPTPTPVPTPVPLPTIAPTSEPLPEPTLTAVPSPTETPTTTPTEPVP
jgi:hypothetical protein